MPDFVDTHCHIQSAGQSVGERHTRELWQKSGRQPDEIIASANEDGVNRLLVVGCDVTDSQLAVDFVAKRDNCWAAIGIHPHEAKEYTDGSPELQAFAGLAERPKVVAIGECGFDFYYNHSSEADQERILRFQLDLAQKHDLPVVFHVREAFDKFWPVFDEYQSIRGVLHSYTDSKDNLEQAINRGLLIGVNGIATFAKDERQLEVYKAIPDNRLLLETDAPYLTPTPYRGNINEPKYVAAIAAFVAALRGVSIDDLAATTTANAQNLFGI